MTITIQHKCTIPDARDDVGAPDADPTRDDVPSCTLLPAPNLWSCLVVSLEAFRGDKRTPERTGLLLALGTKSQK